MRVMNKIVVILIMFFSFKTFAQFTIVPLESISSINKDSDHGGKYYKDVNGILTPYIGVWQWIDGNRKVKLNFYKDENVSCRTINNIEFRRDIIIGYYEYFENNMLVFSSKANLLASLEYNGQVGRGGVGIAPTKHYLNDKSYFTFTDFMKTVCFNGVYKAMSGGGPGYFRILNETTAAAFFATNIPIINSCGENNIAPNFPRNVTIGLTKIASVPPPLQ